MERGRRRVRKRGEGEEKGRRGDSWMSTQRTVEQNYSTQVKASNSRERGRGKGKGGERRRGFYEIFCSSSTIGEV